MPTSDGPGSAIALAVIFGCTWGLIIAMVIVVALA
jgi:hypothetical protein